MSSRTHYRGVDSVPAPNKYCLPPLMGPQVPNKPASASYTMSGSYSTGGPSVDLAKTPGPCRYNSTDPSVYLPRKPAFSMLGRHDLPRDSTKKPGPGAYNPEKVTVHKVRAPAYSLGIRHSEFVTPLVVNVSDWKSSALQHRNKNRYGKKEIFMTDFEWGTFYFVLLPTKNLLNQPWLTVRMNNISKYYLHNTNMSLKNKKCSNA